MLDNFAISGMAASAPANGSPSAIVPSGKESEFCCAIDITAGRVLYDKAANTVYDYPASTVKLMTTLLVAELKGSSLSETVTWQTSDDLDSGFSQVGFGNGDVVTWSDILHGMLMVSGGDACQAAARVLGNEDAGTALSSESGYARFTEMMNQRAKAMGCLNTSFSNAHGAMLHAITARDLAEIAARCFSNPAVAGIALDSAYAINVTGTNARTINLANGNPLIDDAGVKGSKTGSLAGGIYPTTYSLGTCWQAPGGNVIGIVALNSPTSQGRYDDTTEMIASLPTDFPYLV